MTNNKRCTCSKDIVIFLELCEEEQRKVFRRLDKIKIGLFDPDRKGLRQERKELKNRLKNINAKIERWVDVLEDNTTFERSLFLKFLVKYLTLREGVEYTVMYVSEDDVALGIATKTYGCMFTEYQVVTTVDNKKRLQKQGENGTFGGDTDDINEYLNVCKDRKFICLLDEAEEYSLLDGISLSEGFESYPYLKDVAFDLVDLKLQNPYMSDAERLSKVLRDYQKKKTYPRN